MSVEHKIEIKSQSNVLHWVRLVCTICGSHLVSIKTIVVRYKQSGMDCNVAYVIHKLFSGCR